MKTTGLVLALSAATAFTACGGGGGGTADAMPPECNEAGGSACFVRPLMATTVAAGPANWACAPDTLTMSAAGFNVAGEVRDYQNDDLLAGATVEAFLSATDFTTPIATATTDAAGAYTIALTGQIPSRMNWRTKHPDSLDTYEINDPINVAGGDLTGIGRYSVLQDTSDALQAFIGVTPTPGLGVLAGAIRDCDRSEVQHAIATISSTSSAGDVPPTFVGGAQVYYFSSGTTSLPVQRTIREDTNVNGVFVIIEIPPTTGTQTYFLQIWGYKDAAAVTADTLSLLSEFETKVVGDSVIIVDMDPTEGQ